MLRDDIDAAIFYADGIIADTLLLVTTPIASHRTMPRAAMRCDVYAADFRRQRHLITRCRAIAAAGCRCAFRVSMLMLPIFSRR